MSRANKILIIVSFLIVGMIFITNEPPTYSQKKQEIKIEETYDISGINESIRSDVNSIVLQKKQMSMAIKLLKKENISLKKKIDEIAVTEKVEVKLDTTKVDSTKVIPKKKGFIKRILKL